VPGLSSGDSRFATDDGSADPVAAAALDAFASGAGSEHAALTALARVRLLVPVLAAPAQDSGPGADGQAASGQAADDPAAAKTSEMTIPTLVGHDGRAAVPAFTCLGALLRWQPGARPVPVDAGRVWQSAAADSSAVVLDIAGPVPVAIDGARLAALASGQPVPLPHADPDVLAEVTRAIAGQQGIGTARLLPGGADSDLTVELATSPGHRQAAADLAAGAAAVIMARLGSRLRRGIQIVISPPPG
jgi:SseB protein N-terminal domain